MSEKDMISRTTGESKDELDLARIIGLLLDYKWVIISIISLFAIAGILYCLFATPIYKADALVQVEPTIENDLMNDLASVLPTAKPSSDAEIELIKSRLVLGKTVHDLNLNITAEQKFVPIIGAGWARLIGETTAKILITKLNIPDDLIGEELELESLKNNEYILSYNDNILLRCKIGQFCSKNGITDYVESIIAKPGTKFAVKKTRPLTAINNLNKELSVLDAGKDTGVLTLTLTGDDKVKIKNILNSIAFNYLQQNIERKSEEANKSLLFLKSQLPKVRSSLDQAEDRLNKYRQEHDSVDLSLEARSLLEQMVNIENEINQLTIKEAEVSKLYTKKHPSYKTLLDQKKVLEQQKNQLNQQINTMPKTQQEILRLTRDAQSDQSIYIELLNKQQELNISKASTIGNVRIVDNAVTQPQVVEPQKILIMLISVILGAIVSTVYVVIKNLLHRGIEDPAVLEENGITVYASIPLSTWQVQKDAEYIKKYQNRKSNKEAIRKELLTIGNPTDIAIEAMRSLRTSLHFAMLEAKNNVLMISGASPSIGKTFVCTNIAAVFAQAGNNVLLIDADMRKGYLHEIFGLNNNKGLSEIISDQISINEAIKSNIITNLSVITRGKAPPNPSELLLNDKLEKILTWAKNVYDIILIDTPPILAVTDAAIVGRHAGTSLLITRYGINTLKEIKLSINRLEQNGVYIKGAIINSVIKKSSNYYNDYGYYDYDYKSIDS
ncbi:polysaccharide biosynthesis tyrosine autokinase [Martelella alba]|uniref:Polysaccharide biosynthesis tyrosine autokinase n=1 Tax=Martelella alba TaxID=2590451 RepID=A0ABY2SJU4_9HYPH|nr:polysaccharide biosynthesis tyrosine autokinase [Martelella alba]TKI05779.1 polysaccharide biosynthesis tyrosine autokinase [Martelella alba]